MAKKNRHKEYRLRVQCQKKLIRKLRSRNNSKDLKKLVLDKGKMSLQKEKM